MLFVPSILLTGKLSSRAVVEIFDWRLFVNSSPSNASGNLALLTGPPNFQSTSIRRRVTIADEIFPPRKCCLVKASVSPVIETSYRIKGTDTIQNAMGAWIADERLWNNCQIAELLEEHRLLRHPQL
ncbi:hypothetical protein A0H81_02959 [Grifola frondosa]|uniref:Uncharacterized protein n=1 Tax=Grifola frondosa TaxID=5627 RepID=A0A1C7MHF9_GRIFR|nr:hypothetical protein A0H81_02959 [Grifola frondosa]